MRGLHCEPGDSTATVRRHGLFLLPSFFIFRARVLQPSIWFVPCYGLCGCNKAGGGVLPIVVQERLRRGCSVASQAHHRPNGRADPRQFLLITQMHTCLLLSVGQSVGDAAWAWAGAAAAAAYF